MAELADILLVSDLTVTISNVNPAGSIFNTFTPKTCTYLCYSVGMVYKEQTHTFQSNIFI